MGIILPVSMRGAESSLGSSLGRQLMDIADGTIVAEADARRVAAEFDDDEDQMGME